MNEQLKQSCQWCGGHIAYDREYVGRSIQCPHCGKTIALSQPGAVGEAGEASTKRLGSPRNIVAGCILLVLVTGGLGIGLRIAGNHKRAEQQRETQEVARARIEAERLKAEAERAKAEAEKARAEAEAARRKAEEKDALAGAGPQEEASASAAAVKLKAEQDSRVEQERKSRAMANPSIRGLWEEQDHGSIQIVRVRPNDALLKYKGESVIARYEEMPEWLRLTTQKQFKDEGEARGLIRELDGKTYDLRTSPAGWVSLPTAEVIQIIDDGYLVIDVQSLEDRYAQAKVFKLKHNGLVRILNRGDRIQVTAMSVGTYTYEARSGEVQTVPVYDPGVPVGPLREKVVKMTGGSPGTSGRASASADEPSGSGSGFFISDDGLFISNAHVVEDSAKIEVKTAAGKKSATVLRVDKDKDLALLRVSVVKGSVTALNLSTNVLGLGAQVFTIGYPLVELQGSRPKFTDGRVSSLAGVRDDPDEVQISVPVQPGNSGGPLADMNGDIVGVVVGRLNDVRVIETTGSVPQSVNYAVKGTRLLQFLRENKDLAPGVSFGSSSRRTQEEAIQAVEKASGLVLTY